MAQEIVEDRITLRYVFRYFAAAVTALSLIYIGWQVYVWIG
jgi:hypothetical protein